MSLANCPDILGTAIFFRSYAVRQRRASIALKKSTAK